jgi:hypothetical protein
MYTVRTTFLRPDNCTVETPAGSQREAFYVARALAAHLAQKKAGCATPCDLDDCPCTHTGARLAVCAVYDDLVKSTFPIPRMDEVVGVVGWDDDGVASPDCSEILVEDEHGDFEIFRIKLCAVPMK